jgi:hypothetical protein
VVVAVVVSDIVVLVYQPFCFYQCYAMLIEFNSVHHDSDMEAKTACVSKQIATCVRFNNPGQMRSDT